MNKSYLVIDEGFTENLEKFNRHKTLTIADDVFFNGGLKILISDIQALSTPSKNTEYRDVGVEFTVYFKGGLEIRLMYKTLHNALQVHEVISEIVEV